MSKFWAAEQAQDFEPVAIGGFAAAGRKGAFRALYGQQGLARAPIDSFMMPQEDDEDDEAPSIDPVEQARAEAFAQGFDEGCRSTADALSGEMRAADRLAEALEQLSPTSSGTLATMLSTAVTRLVAQIVGEVDIDLALLQQRCESVASFIDENEGRSALHMNPEDVPLVGGATIGVPVVSDASLPRGCVRLDTAEGWIEDGPDVRLSRLKALLDDMEGRL